MKVKLLWYDGKYGHGIVEDENGNEYYIDDSVLKLPKEKLFRNSISNTGLELEIDINVDIRDCLCGKNVRLIGD
jgi:hypothetical protein